MKLKIIIIILFLFTSQAFAGTVYYLDGQSGNDLNDGLTLATAWKTIKKANQTLVAGDTVYIRGGTYREANPGAWVINPANSGTPGNYITYQNYNNEEVYLGGLIDGNIHMAGLTDRSYIKIDGIKSAYPVKWWVRMTATSGNTCSHNIIQNCLFDGNDCKGSPWGGITLGSTDAANRGTVEYNRIINNDFINMDCSPKDAIYFVFGDCRYNLIEGNYFDGASHVTIEMQPLDSGDIEYNIIRNNTIRNEYHTCLNPYGGSSWNLIEGNTIIDAGENYLNNVCGSEKDRNSARYLHGGIQLEGTHNIIRRNVMYNCGRMAVENYGADGCDNNKIYNNTFYENYRDWDSVTGADVDGNIAKNNIFWASRKTLVEHDVQGARRDNYFINNCMSGNADLIFWYPSPGYKTPSWMEANYPLLWSGNITTDPAFINAAGRDFRLGNNSPCIDAGAWLTEITSSGGSGQSFAVSDASYFCDGWGIIPGDVIQLEGETQTVKVTNVDYVSNTISVDTSLSYYSGQGVSLAYSGFSPDIGADEYQQTGDPLIASASASSSSGYIPLTINFTGSATGGNSPYSYSWDFGDENTSTSQNPSHTYTTAADFSVTLTVTDDDNNQDTDTLIIHALNMTHGVTTPDSPTGQSIGSPGSPYTYDTGGSSCSLGHDVEYHFDWGDGSFSTWSSSTSVSHSWSTTGTYTVRVQARCAIDTNIVSDWSSGFTVEITNSTIYDLSLSSATGSPASGQGGTTNPAPGSYTYINGNSAQITVLPNTNYRFSKWTGDIDVPLAYEEDVAVTMDQNRSITANFYTKCGDVNGDLNITPSDSQLAFDIFLGRYANPTDAQKENADVNSDGTPTDPLITPADSQAIFEKFLGMNELPSDCSCKSRAASLEAPSTQTASSRIINLTTDDFNLEAGERVEIPVSVDSLKNLKSFGIDITFPSELFEFVEVKRTEITEDFIQVDGHKVSEGLLRVGGYSINPINSTSSSPLVILVFEAKEKTGRTHDIAILNTHDDLKNNHTASAQIFKRQK